MGDGQTDRDPILAGQALSPRDEIERLISAFEEQIMDGIWLFRDREVELAGRGERLYIGQNGREIVQVKRGLCGVE